METYMQVLQKMLKINNYICEYCNGCLKNQLLNLYANIIMDIKKTMNYLQHLYVGITMDVKKTNNYLQDLYVGIVYLKWPYAKDVGVAQCSF